jgi:hypothetical protein
MLRLPVSLELARHASTPDLAGDGLATDDAATAGLTRRASACNRRRTARDLYGMSDPGGVEKLRDEGVFDET